MVRAIIPACGFGTRVGMKSNESKEMLPEFKIAYDPIIQYSLDLCKKYDIDPLVLVRKEKLDLIDYLKKGNIKYYVMEPGKEWAETVYNSKDHWNDKNILLLPDTRFEPTNIMQQLKQSLEFGSEIVFAVHKVDDISQWGCVTVNGYCEKPQINKPGHAWGLIGFTKDAGEILFSEMQSKSHVYLHEPQTNFLFLESFKDITRKL